MAILIAAFNEELCLRELLPAIPRRLAGLDCFVVVVSDGSTDGTVAAARPRADLVVAEAFNRGKGAALRVGLEALSVVEFDYLVTMDADGQHDPGDLPALLRPLIDGSADVAFGSRYLRSAARGDVPRNRYLVRRATIRVLERVAGCRTTDPYCGYRAFTRDGTRALRLRGDRYEGELEVIFNTSRFGLRSVEVPVRKIYHPGSSKMGARYGRFLGRVAVVSGYARTILRESARLNRARPDRSLQPTRNG